MSVEIVGQVDLLAASLVETLVQQGVLRSAWYAESVDSTNTRAVRDIREGLIPEDAMPRLYLTDQQTAGRGRRGREWMSGDGNLAFSLVMPTADLPPSAINLQSIAVGVAIAQAIEHEFAPMKVQLKWPNDLWMDGGKVAGVLIERVSTTDRCVVIGIGVNVNSSPNTDQETRSVAQCIGRPVDRFQVLTSVIERLVEVQQELADNAGYLMDEFQKRCRLTGKEIQFQLGGQSYCGQCLGINEDGSLGIEQQGTRISIESGEATLVRIQSGSKS